MLIWADRLICRFTHAELQALWKICIGRIWDSCPSPNAIHVLGCSYWDPPKGADSCIQSTGNILKLAVKKIEQSSPSREENRWVGTWQWWPAGGCFWWMLSHWFPSLISSSCSIHTAQPSLPQPHVSAGFVGIKARGISWQDTQFMYFFGFDSTASQFLSGFPARAPKKAFVSRQEIQ